MVCFHPWMMKWPKVLVGFMCCVFSSILEAGRGQAHFTASKRTVYFFHLTVISHAPASVLNERYFCQTSVKLPKLTSFLFLMNDVCH